MLLQKKSLSKVLIHKRFSKITFPGKAINFIDNVSIVRGEIFTFNDYICRVGILLYLLSKEAKERKREA